MPEKDGFRLLHTMLRVKDLDKALDFYPGCWAWICCARGTFLVVNSP